MYIYYYYYYCINKIVNSISSTINSEQVCFIGEYELLTTFFTKSYNSRFCYLLIQPFPLSSSNSYDKVNLFTPSQTFESSITIFLKENVNKICTRYDKNSKLKLMKISIP